MGRKLDETLRKYFVGSGEDSKCKSCSQKVNSSFTTLMKRHLKRKHVDLYEDYSKQIKLENENEDDENNKKIKFSLEMSPNQIINICIDFVVKQSLPLSFFDSEPFNALTSGIFESLKIPKISSRNIMTFVEEKNAKLIAKIKDITDGKIISLKIDTATRADRRILGVNAQLFHNGKIIIITLGFTEVNKSHTAINLKVEIDEILNLYNIKKSQIYSVTTDNGRNLVKTVDLLAEEPLQYFDEISFDEDDDNEDSDVDTSQSDNEVEEEDFCENIVNCIKFDNILSIKCAAHTLQLAVRDFIVNLNINVIKKARNLAKLLRTSKYRNIWKSLNLKKPIVDVPTRWMSTYVMLTRLLDYKLFCSEYLEQRKQLSSNDWIIVEDIVATLTPANSLNLSLQKSDLLLGDFYKLWLQMTFQLQAANNELSDKLLHYVQSRQNALLEHNIMYSAIFLDPRLRRTLSKEKIKVAKLHLKALIRQMETMKQSTSQTQQDMPSSSSILRDESFLMDDSSMQSSSSILRSGILDLEVGSSSSDDEESHYNDYIERAFIEIECYKGKKIDIENDLVIYWQNNYQFPILSKLAMIIHSVPATQVSVERSFSALKLILSDLRHNISEANLKTIMMLKLNIDVMCLMKS